MMGRNVILGTSILLLLVLATAGCSLKRNPPEMRYFALDLSPTGDFRIPGDGVLLNVSKLTISPRYEGREFVYHKSDSTYESDFYNRFFITPSEEVTNATREWLANSGTASRFLGSRSPIQPTHSIVGNVVALYGDFQEKGTPRAVLKVEFSLQARVHSEFVIRFQKTYAQAVAMESAAPDSLVKGWTAGLTAILTELARDLQQADFSLPAKGS